MVILEGPDLSGKTTLAKLITQTHLSRLVHLGLPPTGVRHWDIAKTALLYNAFNTVYDRMVMGSWVFRQVKPDRFNIDGVTTLELLRWFQLVEQLQPSLVIRCLAKPATLHARFKARGDEYITVDDLTASAALYDQAFTMWRAHNPGAFITYNSSLMEPQAFIDHYRHRISTALADDNFPTPDQYNAVMLAMS